MYHSHSKTIINLKEFIDLVNNINRNANKLYQMLKKKKSMQEISFLCVSKIFQKGLHTSNGTML